MPNGNGDKKGFWGFPDTVRLLMWLVGILLTATLVLGGGLYGRQTLSGDVQALELKVETQTVEFKNIDEDIDEIKEDIKIINNDNKEQNRMIQEIHQEILRKQ